MSRMPTPNNALGFWGNGRYGFLQFLPYNIFHGTHKENTATAFLPKRVHRSATDRDQDAVSLPQEFVVRRPSACQLQITARHITLPTCMPASHRPRLLLITVAGLESHPRKIELTIHSPFSRAECWGWWVVPGGRPRADEPVSEAPVRDRGHIASWITSLCLQRQEFLQIQPNTNQISTISLRDREGDWIFQVTIRT